MNTNAYPIVNTYSDLEGLPVGTIVNVHIQWKFRG